MKLMKAAVKLMKAAVKLMKAIGEMEKSYWAYERLLLCCLIVTECWRRGVEPPILVRCLALHTLSHVYGATHIINCHIVVLALCPKTVPLSNLTP